MRRTFPIFLLLLLGTMTIAMAAGSGNDKIPAARAWLPGERADDIPIQQVPSGLRADTTWYGQYQVIDGDYYALPFNNKDDGSWTFDRGTGPFGQPEPVIENGEGWTAYDLTVNVDTYFRVIDNTLDLGEGVLPPVISGAQSLWVGADLEQSGLLCWDCGPGYGNDWCQRVVSEPLSYNGSGDVSLTFLYWSYTERCFDGTQVYLRRSDNSELMLNPFPVGECADNTGYTGGTFTDSIGHWSEPAFYDRSVTAAEIGGAQTIRIIFEFSSDIGWSDEDCDRPTIWGPFGADNISISGGGVDVSYDFEDGLQGWEPGTCNPIGHFVDIVDLGLYTILDPCACQLAGNILEMHAATGDEGVHPVGQHVRVVSPVCDLGGNELKTIFMEFDMYAELPEANGVMIMPGWYYYPHVCEATGVIGWSPRIGQEGYNWFGADPLCATWRYGGTDLGTGGTPVPADAEMVRAAIDMTNDCVAFAIDPCSGITNFTPLFDNLSVGVTEGIVAPIVDFDIGCRYQDTGSYPADLFSPRAVGPANITRDKNMDTPPGSSSDRLGDTLVVAGPIPGADPNSRWGAKLWFRVAKRGPFQADREEGADTRYKIWKERVSDGLAIDRPYDPPFAWAHMDSAQIGFVVSRNKFISEFREDDDDFVGEGNPENEIIWDDCLRPGTRIEYFVTSSYAVTPNAYFYRPDTTGGFFMEFEVLPGIRTANVPNCGGTGFNYCVYQPAVLYIDAFNGGAQFFIENSLRTVLNGFDPCLDENGCEIPENRNWDRYDYLDAASNWNAPFVRGSVAGSNNGMTLNQILGYRAILLNTGGFDSGTMQDEDFRLFDQWLFSPDCSSNINRQVFIMNGDKAGEVLEQPGGQDIDGHGLAFLNNVFGATLLCDAFNGVTSDPDCGSENSSFCVRWLPVGGGAFSTETDVDAWGSYCPNLIGFNVFSLNGGTGNRYYSAEDGTKDMVYAQIVNEDLSGSANYRAVLDGVSWHHLTARDLGNPEDPCPRDTPSIVDGSLTEIGAALKWGFGVGSYDGIPKLASSENLANCQGTWDLPSDIEDGSTLLVNRLYQNQPNPFNPRTSLRFSLARAGRIELVIYDVNGRLVRTLVDENREAGVYTVEWDGTNDQGHRVGSGVYWSQMKSGSFVSNKKVVILK